MQRYTIFIILTLYYDVIWLYIHTYVWIFYLFIVIVYITKDIRKFSYHIVHTLYKYYTCHYDTCIVITYLYILLF